VIPHRLDQLPCQAKLYHIVITQKHNNSDIDVGEQYLPWILRLRNNKKESLDFLLQCHVGQGKYGYVTVYEYVTVATHF
jgi:hypothetical protein